MDPFLQKQIVDILITDVVLILNWKKFFQGLNLKTEDFVQLERQVNNGTMKGYELFTTILTQWSSAEGSNATIDVLRHVLEDNDFRSVAEQLENAITPPERRKTDSHIWFEVPRTTINFVGREKELKELKQLYKSHKFLLVVTTTGMGGVGKSELVKNFAKEIAATESADCIWLNGETKQSLQNSIRRFANFVKLPKLELDQPIDVQFYRSVLTIKELPRILVIIDNVDVANEEVQKLISKIPADRCFFLVTSRNVGVLEYAGTIIKLDILLDESAVDLLKKSGLDEPDDEIMKLCALLGNFPLALNQAAAYIKMQKHSGVKGESYKIADYIETYEKQKRKLLGYKLNLIDHDYKETTLITWNISFEKIKTDKKFGTLPIQLLNTIAYFQPDGIQVEFLNLYQKDLLKPVLLVKIYSLVKVENGVISIHRLVQQVIQLNLSSDQLEIPQLQKIITAIQPILEPAERLVGLEGHLYPEHHEKSLVEEERSLKHIKNGMGHIVSVLKHAAQHSQLLTNFKNVLIATYNNLRFFEFHQLTIDLCHATVNQLNKLVGSNTELTLRVRSELAFAQCRLDKQLNTRNLLALKSVYAQQFSILGEEHESTLSTAHYIADIQENYSFQFSDKVNAVNIHWCREVLELKTKVFGPLHKSTCSTQLVLAKYLYLVDKNYKEAVGLFKECFQWQMTHLGAEGSDTYDIFQSYVKCLLKMSNGEEANSVVEQHLQQELTESKHRVYKDFSLVLYSLGKTEEAFSTLGRAINIENVYDEVSDFDSKVSKYKYADILLRDKNYSEALITYVNLKLAQFNCNWLYAELEYKKSQCLIGLNEIKQAQEVLKQALTIQSTLFGNNCKPTVETKMLLDEVDKKIAAARNEQVLNTDFVDSRVESSLVVDRQSIQTTSTTASILCAWCCSSKFCCKRRCSN